MVVSPAEYFPVRIDGAAVVNTAIQFDITCRWLCDKGWRCHSGLRTAYAEHPAGIRTPTMRGPGRVERAGMISGNIVSAKTQAFDDGHEVLGRAAAR